MTMEDIKKQVLVKKIKDIQSAPDIWNNWCREFDIGLEDCVLLFPEKVNENTKYFLMNIELLMRKRKYKRTHIIVFDNEILRMLPNGIENCTAHIGNESEMNKVVLLYSLFEFSNRLYICSLSIPDGRMGEQMKKKEYHCSIEEIVKIGIFRLG